MSRDSSSLLSLLPQGAIVMARKGTPSLEPELKQVLQISGTPGSKILFIAEGLGLESLSTLLKRMIEAMKLPQDLVSVANIPSFSEFELGAPFEEIQGFEPTYTVLLGVQIAHHLMESKLPISALRGRIHERETLRFLATHSLADLAAKPELKKETWADLQLILREI